MNIKEIKDFYKKSNNFLKHNQSKEMIGIPYLNPHLPRSILINSNKINFSFLKKVFNFISKIFKSNQNYNFFLNKNYKYLILSHLVSYDHLNYNNDFYFGNLAKKLNYNKVLFVLIDHIGFEKKNIKKKIKGNYIILSKKLSLFTEIKLFLKTSIKVFYKNFFYQNLRLNNLKNILSSIDNQRISLQLKEILERHSFENFFFTYEGNPYEKLICYEAQNLNKNLRKIGYQFGVIRKFQYSIYSFINKKFDPDVIFTISKYNKKLLVSKLKNRLKIYNFGLLKDTKIYFRKNKNLKNRKKIKILVMPEGILNEIKLFLDFCYKNQSEQIEFTFRLHPIFLKSDYINQEIKKIGSNVKISKNKLEDDIMNNQYLLYRGTAAVINAVNLGLIPIYLHKKNQVSIDPLFQINKRHIIEYDYKLLSFIKEILNKKEMKKEIFKIKKFSYFFYDKPKFSKLIKFLNKK